MEERRAKDGTGRDKLRDKFELLLGLLRATARIQDSVNYAPKCFIIKHFTVLIVAPTITAGNETRKMGWEGGGGKKEERSKNE